LKILNTVAVKLSKTKNRKELKNN